MKWAFRVAGLLVWLVALAAAGQLHEDPGDPHVDPSQPLGHGAEAPDAEIEHGEHGEHGEPKGPAADPHAGHAAPRAAGSAGDAPEQPDHPPGHQTAGEHHAHHGMTLDAGGMVMNHNPDRLPRDCPRIAAEVEIRVRAGRAFAAAPGLTYGYDASVWEVAPCSRVNVTLENEDQIRHQWMVHGLPRYLYPMGMFTLEVNGPGTRSASFIVPSADKTYLVHCDVPHHMEKGMKAQLVVGGGDGNLPSVPGISEPLFGDDYPERWIGSAALAGAVAIALGLALSLALLRR